MKPNCFALTAQALFYDRKTPFIIYIEPPPIKTLSEHRNRNKNLPVYAHFNEITCLKSDRWILELDFVQAYHVFCPNKLRGERTGFLGFKTVRWGNSVSNKPRERSKLTERSAVARDPQASHIKEKNLPGPCRGLTSFSPSKRQFRLEQTRWPSIKLCAFKIFFFPL